MHAPGVVHAADGDLHNFKEDAGGSPGNFEGFRKESISMPAALFSAKEGIAAKNAEVQGKHGCI